MRRISGILTVALILISFAEAEAGIHGGGIKGGILISSPSGERDAYDVESISTFTYGAFYRYSFNRTLSFQTEFDYARKGSKGTYYSAPGQVNITYIDFASMIQYRLLQKNGIFSDLYAGPMISLNLDASVERESLDRIYSYGIYDETKHADLGIVLGAKFGFSHRSNEYGIDMRYSSGFIAPDDTGADIDLKNRTFSFMLEIYFGNGSFE